MSTQNVSLPSTSSVISLQGNWVKNTNSGHASTTDPTASVTLTQSMFTPPFPNTPLLTNLRRYVSDLLLGLWTPQRIYLPFLRRLFFEPQWRELAVDWYGQVSKWYGFFACASPFTFVPRWVPNSEHRQCYSVWHGPPRNHIRSPSQTSLHSQIRG